MQARVSLLAAALLTGCTVPTAPPALSLARFVRLPEARARDAPPPATMEASPDTKRTATGEPTATGRIGAALGLLFAVEDDADGGSTLYSVVPEGALTLWLLDRYDLSIAVHPQLLSIEGNVSVIDAPMLRLGILHGVGAQLQVCIASGVDSCFTLQVDLMVGAMAQFANTRFGAGFVGVRYAYATSVEESGTDVFRPVHYAMGSLGYAFAAGGLHVTPEFALTYGRWRPADGEPAQGFWLLLPGVSVAAEF